ncbi:hypothetical protein [Noviherbaspirillum pedocola]|uniref:Uncharacterized protein n=1 Tax=Noviherbaspirillum pedocola TaxID=2801341 RepID=A0A934SYS4_9BURK|nr:hypothetical protein [Noviherbaspirillum pedocola]MBK4738078.1 hypothetical protein [Noviherbaspirillum pedocola]
MTRFFHALIPALFLLLPQLASAGTLADVPLSLKGGVPPNVMFALSTEFPTAITAAYQGASDYSATNEYLGYFDPNKCYSYNTSSGYFYPVAAANNHACSTWSGNFLNWATMTGLDEFRYAMTGGQRVVDSASLTVLERTYLPNQGSASSNFTDKTFVENGTTTPYPVTGSALTIQNWNRGAQMLVTPNGTDVANCNNPTLANGSFSCGSIVLTSSGTTATCTAWSGSGTSSSPYLCTAFSYAGGITASSASQRSVSSASSGSSSSSTTVTCANPSFASSPFFCDLTMSGGATGTCNTWSGSGTSASPYLCSSFNTFSSGSASYTFAPTGSGNSTSSFTTTTQGGQVSENVSCSAVSGSTAINCPMSNGDVATCTSFKADNKGVYYCNSSFGFTTGGATSTNETYVSNSVRNSSTASTSIGGGKYTYYTQYTLTYKSNTTQASYYISSYPGTTSSSGVYYYVSSYSVAFGSSQTYNVRVQVCDPTVSLESNCKQYGSSYKPTGTIQQNGDIMRFGVTSYFQANDIDNAVLRSKAKYVAPTMYSSAGQTVANPNAEWAAGDGTLYANPDAGDSATVNSFIGSTSNTGVINYINKFGSVSKSYKTYDDLRHDVA